MQNDHLSDVMPLLPSRDSSFVVPHSSSPMAAVETEKLTHHYGLRVALHELTLRVEPGEAFALLGPNGSGKTTLFRILSTLIPPTDGRAIVLGRDLSVDRDRIAVRRDIGVVF